MGLYESIKCNIDKKPKRSKKLNEASLKEMGNFAGRMDKLRAARGRADVHNNNVKEQAVRRASELLSEIAKIQGDVSELKEINNSVNLWKLKDNYNIWLDASGRGLDYETSDPTLRNSNITLIIGDKIILNSSSARDTIDSSILEDYNSSTFKCFVKAATELVDIYPEYIRSVNQLIDEYDLKYPELQESCGKKKKLNESLEPGWFTANKEEVDKLYKMAVGSDNLDYIKEQLDAIYAIAKKEITGNVNESCDKEEIKESIYELSPEYVGRQSYYGKAQVETNNGESTLYSYGTPIMKINSNGEIEMLCSERHLTNTTIRHIREFMQQNGFSPIPKQKLVNYINNGEKIVESCKKEPVKEAGNKEGAAKRKSNRRKKNLEWLKSQVDKKPMSDLSDEDRKGIKKNIDDALSTYKESCKGRKRTRKSK